MSEPATIERVYLQDYRPPDFLITSVNLDFELAPDTTLVRSVLSVSRNSSNIQALRLDGEDLELLAVRIDGQALAQECYTLTEQSLTIHDVPDRFELEIENRINPCSNTKLEGLYLSGGNFCTQCEPEGFRRITYFLDRPDVLSEYSVTIRAPHQSCPVLLSNGNNISCRMLPGGMHQVTWHDPYPKPCYLFALVGGDLQHIEDHYTTAGGRKVCLRIYAVKRDLGQCRHAMDALKQSMHWDEVRYGREYDLDCFNIVAVEDFNMGAMENKGLNVFNTRYVLALPETATDQDYQAITGVIGHEYFHNWSGNRVTCRDWFQLSLKEGFTVFRDQQFSAELGSAGVKRSEDANLVRTHQFREAAGPMAHPVRPDSYAEINNFYTLTVYLKGAEVVRMLASLLGPDLFRRGCDLYFERHDGQAVTTDDFVTAMEDVAEIDLAQFRLWYDQACTPKLTARSTYEAQSGRYTLTLCQHCESTPGVDSTSPFHIPVAAALFDRAGEPLMTRLEPLATSTHEHMLSLTKNEQEFVFEDVRKAPVISLLRGFSAPVELEIDQPDDDVLVLMGHDNDPFNRWDAGQRLASKEILRAFSHCKSDEPFSLDDGFACGFHNILQAQLDDASFQAFALRLPEEAYLSNFTEVIEPVQLHQARKAVKQALASRFRADFERLYHVLSPSGPAGIDSADTGRRALRNACLSYLMTLEEPQTARLALDQLASADNMTDAVAALAELARSPHPERSEALEQFYRRWESYPLVMDKWFRAQAVSDLPGTLEHVQKLTEHEKFQLGNPNKVHALLGAFSHTNPLHFHAADGPGYTFITDQILKIDPANPQVAARLVSAFNLWRRYNTERQRLMRSELERIQSTVGLSRDVSEIIERVLT